MMVDKYMETKKESYQPLAEGVGRSLNSRETHLNNNICVVGPSGSQKSRGVVIPTILSANESLVISDPKGAIYRKYASVLRTRGYNVQKISFINPEKSVKYNPLTNLTTSHDIKALSNVIIYTKPYEVGGRVDPFWDQTSECLLSALIAYIKENPDSDLKLNFETIFMLLDELSADEDNIESCILSKRMKAHNCKLKSEGKSSFAYRQYSKFLQTPQRTICTILTTVHAALAVFDTDEMLTMLSSNELNIEELGEKKTALFVEVSDVDRSMDAAASILYSQIFKILCRKADKTASGELKVPVRFIFDDFATNVRIPNFDSIISNIRARNISVLLAIQSESQLVKQFHDSYETIMENCDTILYMGVNSLNSARNLSERADIPVKQALSMKPQTCYVFEHGKEPRLCRTINLEHFISENKIKLFGFKEDL